MANSAKLTKTIEVDKRGRISQWRSFDSAASAGRTGNSQFAIGRFQTEPTSSVQKLRPTIGRTGLVPALPW